ncbi:hypothetical protein F0L17_15105 [Streptomyces sp. TRM43335]|uniref:Integral membrane protein n=1 Tax=Streptomyces taklimakanensis TaxID=2569853 RepID=A0A6G2BET0_9ACTN|nr:hypothetical protein [Streptomyces taklimakanensis]MTE20412.1 hypothetical protein [Streptomyces taklimakanensis]
MSEQRERPEPEPIRFYGTTWVDHSGGYSLRRYALGLGALLLAVAGALVLRLAYQGMAIAEAGTVLSTLFVVAFAVCSSMAFSRTLGDYTRGPDDARGPDDPSMRSIKAVGFLGVLLAYALRSAVEAPGEKRRRAEYDRAVERYERRDANRAARRGNPAARRGNGSRSGRRR